MLENYLIYDGVDTRLATKGYQFFMQNEAPELSFDFNQILYDEDTEQRQYTTNGNQELLQLNELQIAEIQDYLNYYMDEHDYTVHAYVEPYNLFEGTMPVSMAKEKGYSYRINEMPTQKCPKWDEEKQKWVECILLIMDDGTPNWYPESICPHCVKGFTYDEVQLLPEQPSPFYIWDLKTDTWADPRTLEEAKRDAYVSIRADFEVRRHEHSPYGYFIGDYESITWQTQFEEAKHWLEDNSYSTPYIDAFLSARTDVNIPTKEEFCNDVITNHNEFLTAMARINAEQWKYLALVKKATTNDECFDILDEAKRYCQGLSTGVQAVV